jgi:hypothetical protein
VSSKPAAPFPNAAAVAPAVTGHADQAADLRAAAGRPTIPCRGTRRGWLACAAALLAGVATSASPARVLAQAAPDTPRRIPGQAVLGTLNIGVFPQASVNGRTVTLAPGFRLLDRDSRIVVPSTVSGRNQQVAYVTGPVGEVLTAWLLTDGELAAIRRRASSGR